MADRQLQYLNRSRIDALRSGEYLLRLEPLLLPAKKLETIGVGDWIDLGERLPELEVARDGRKIASAYLDEGGVRIGEPAAEPSGERPGRKRIVLEGRLSVLPVSVLQPGVTVPLPEALWEHIYLYDGAGRFRAAARLIAYEGGYALKLEEVADG
jgi:hypothetical protein